MSRYLCQTTEVYRIDSELEAKQAIEEAKNASQYQLLKYTCEYKEIKEKKEVVETFYKLTLVKHFNDLKYPESDIEVTYSSEPSFLK